MYLLAFSEGKLKRTMSCQENEIERLKEVIINDFQNHELDFEVLSEEKYQARLENEPKPLPLPTAEERLEALGMVLLKLL